VVKPDFPDMANQVRAAWLEALYPAATVCVAEDGPPNDAPDRDHWRFVAALLAPRATTRCRIVERGVWPGFADHLGATHVAVDNDRSSRPVTGLNLD
jgi:hypothetical protein